MVTLNDERLHMSPVHKRMQMSIVRVEPGLAVLSMPLTEDLRGYFEGSIDGGMLATFADAASASCLEGAYDFDSHFPVTTDIHVRYTASPRVDRSVPRPIWCTAVAGCSVRSARSSTPKIAF